MKSHDYQRKDAPSNAFAGREFEKLVQHFLTHEGVHLEPDFSLEIGISAHKKERKFDLGCDIKNKKIVVECKSHRWTESDNIPSTKITVWNESMYYFTMCPDDYRKIFFCLKHSSSKRQYTLADYYVKHYAHMIPEYVEFWEYDMKTKTASKLRLQN